MADYRRRRFVAVVIGTALAISGVWLAVDRLRRNPESNSRRPEPKPKDAIAHLPVSEISSSPYRNTGAQAKFVGSGVCVDCHREQHATFAKTPHSRALADIQPSEEPPSARFFHKKTGRTYEVYRKGGEFRHREFLTEEGQGDVLLGDFPVKYRIGSGHHSRSYLMEIDGYLVESPVTWYASKSAWGMSPGYDMPSHPAFSRAAHEGCIHCHAGRVETSGGGTHRLKFHEQKIGCESCHGPGSLHVQFRREQTEPFDGVDHTIVQPNRLSRDLNEAICARCHLRAEAFTVVRGRHRNDFRPGLPLTDFRIDYRAESSSSSMKVTGHFEQMHASRCYTQSQSMTCTTCHNPHFTPSAAERTAYYRRKCQSCHAGDEGCQLPEKTRLAKRPQNDCASCHMPRSGTEIPHLAFTHHRIGLKHATRYEAVDRGRVTTLVPFGDLSRLPPPDRDRCLGLAYMHYSAKAAQPAQDIYIRRAFQLLGRAYEGGVRDAAVIGGLAELHWREKSDRCIELAENALRAPDCNPVTRVHCLIVLGDRNLHTGNIAAAKAAFTTLTTIRRWDTDWQMLGICLMRERNPKGAIRAYLKALAIRRDRPELHELLAEAYDKAGDPDSAATQRSLAERLKQASMQAIEKRP